MEYPKQITTIQAAAVLISTIIGVGVLPLPLFAVRAGDTGAPLVTLLAIGLAFIGLWLLSMLGMRFPTKSIVQYSEDILGKWIARAGTVLIITFFAILTSLTAREFGEVVLTSVLRKTPLEITVIVMLLLAAVSARNNLTTFAYIHHFYLPLLVAPALLIVTLSLKNAELFNLQPLFGNEHQGFGEGILTIAALFQGSFVLTMIIPMMRRPEHALRASIAGIGIAGGTYLSIVIAVVGVFGAEETKRLLWPTLELAKTTTLPANILERLDAAFLAVWVTAVFTTLLSSYYFTIHSIGRLFRIRDNKMLALFILPFVFTMAMLPQSLLQLYDIIEIVGRIGLLITIAYPLLLLLIAMFRGKREDAYAGKQKNRSG